jgi:hypothetical protein
LNLNYGLSIADIVAIIEGKTAPNIIVSVKKLDIFLESLTA